MHESNPREVVDQVVSQQDEAAFMATELAWCRIVGFSESEWQRLRFMRWLYRQDRLTEFPQGQPAVPAGILPMWQDDWRWKTTP